MAFCRISNPYIRQDGVGAATVLAMLGAGLPLLHPATTSHIPEAWLAFDAAAMLADMLAAATMLRGAAAVAGCHDESARQRRGLEESDDRCGANRCGSNHVRAVNGRPRLSVKHLPRTPDNGTHRSETDLTKASCPISASGYTVTE